MPGSRIPRYFALDQEWGQYDSQLKLTRCQFCKAVGYLNRHGYLKGFDEGQPARIARRGCRYFCSNRNRRRGCGRTYSILWAGVLKRCVTSAHTLWRFARALSGGSSVPRAWRQLDSIFCLSSAYSWRRRLRQALPQLRSRLHRIAPVPPSTSSQPLAQTMEHLDASFPDVPCPIAAFQQHFQQPFFA